MQSSFQMSCVTDDVADAFLVSRLQLVISEDAKD